MRLLRLLKYDLANETAEWVEDNILSISQAEQICARYGVDFHQAQKRSFGYNVLIGLGYLFIGLALITLISANWDEIPRALRMWGLIVLTMATQGFALKKYLAADYGSATGLFFLGNLFYGASIILIAQIYHLGEHMPDGVFWWALGCLPIAILINSPWVTLQTAVLSLVWFFTESHMGFYPALFPIFILGSLIFLCRDRQSIAIFITTVISIGTWVEYSLAYYWGDGRRFDFTAEHVAVSVALFIFAYVFSHWLDNRQSTAAKDYGALLAIWSLRFGLIFMLVMSFKQPWEEMIEADWDHKVSMFVLVSAISASALLLAYINKKLIPLIYILSFFWLSLVALLWIKGDDHAIYLQIVYNLVLIAASIWLIIKGIQRGISYYFYLGVTSVLVTALMRYIDLIGDYIGGALLFMVFAALLIGSAKYWKIQRSREGAS
jgi:uncharacterized membrane protein